MPYDTLTRPQILQSSIKHLTRLLEAELATLPTDKHRSSDALLDTGMTTLMARNTALPSRKFAPYEHISKGVAVGYEDNNDSIWVVVDFEPADSIDVGAEMTPRRAPRLRLHPVFSSQIASRWMTMEVDLHDFVLQDVDALTVSLLSNFDFKRKNQALHTNVVGALLRAIKVAGDYEDLELGYFPITTMPLLHKLIVTSDRFDLKRMGGEVQYRLILFLPTFGDYTFNLYDLSIEIS